MNRKLSYVVCYKCYKYKSIFVQTWAVPWQALKRMHCNCTCLSPHPTVHGLGCHGDVARALWVRPRPRRGSPYVDAVPALNPVYRSAIWVGTFSTKLSLSSIYACNGTLWTRIRPSSEFFVDGWAIAHL